MLFRRTRREYPVETHSAAQRWREAIPSNPSARWAVWTCPPTLQQVTICTTLSFAVFSTMHFPVECETAIPSRMVGAVHARLCARSARGVRESRTTVQSFTDSIQTKRYTHSLAEQRFPAQLGLGTFRVCLPRGQRPYSSSLDRRKMLAIVRTQRGLSRSYGATRKHSLFQIVSPSTEGTWKPNYFGCTLHGSFDRVSCARRCGADC